ncbi:hypothetical protein EDB89DRAFT_1902867 [Lactarius sanguifluus]|nr:hypothetical protein EDB89DRAFT_1902867 [Lactarius sanguifluus]
MFGVTNTGTVRRKQPCANSRLEPYLDRNTRTKQKEHTPRTCTGYHIEGKKPDGRITQLPIKLAMTPPRKAGCFFTLPSPPFWSKYLTKDGLRDMYIFTQRQTSEKGQRGFHLSSLGILLARSFCPRPWHHVPALKALGNSSQDVWEPVRRFFGLRKARLEDLGGAGAWHRWSEELEFDMDDGGVEDGSDGYEVLLTGTLVGKQSQVDDSIIAYAFDKALPGDSNGAW